MSVRLSFGLMKQLGFHWTDLIKFDIRILKKKPVKKIQVLLKSEYYNGYLTRAIYIFDYVTLSSENEKWIRQKL